MKKIFIIFCLLVLCSCEVGKFPENRERLHNSGVGKDFCEKNPQRCYQGIPW